MIDIEGLNSPLTRSPLMAMLSNDLIRVHGLLLLAMIANAGFRVTTWLLPARVIRQGAVQLLSLVGKLCISDMSL